MSTFNINEQVFNIFYVPSDFIKHSPHPQGVPNNTVISPSAPHPSSSRRTAPLHTRSLDPALLMTTQEARSPLFCLMTCLSPPARAPRHSYSSLASRSPRGWDPALALPISTVLLKRSFYNHSGHPCLCTKPTLATSEPTKYYQNSMEHNALQPSGSLTQPVLQSLITPCQSLNFCSSCSPGPLRILLPCLSPTNPRDCLQLFIASPWNMEVTERMSGYSWERINLKTHERIN